MRQQWRRPLTMLLSVAMGTNMVTTAGALHDLPVNVMADGVLPVFADAGETVGAGTTTVSGGADGAPGSTPVTTPSTTPSAEPGTSAAGSSDPVGAPAPGTSTTGSPDTPAPTAPPSSVPAAPPSNAAVASPSTPAVPPVVAPAGTGDFVVTGDSSDGYNFAGGVLTFNRSGDYTVSMAGGKNETTTQHIAVGANFEGTITIKNVKIDVSGLPGDQENLKPAFGVDGSAKLTLKLEGENVLKSGGYNAGLQFQNAADGAYLRITADNNSGSLEVEGGKEQQTTAAVGGAGIGGQPYASGKNITIEGGTITAIGGSGGAGIGGGDSGEGENIKILGGVVTASGAEYNGAGIGGGGSASGKNIEISGGIVTAKSPSGGAGIGAGGQITGENSVSTIKISGGTVTATSSQGAGIGSGYQAEEKGGCKVIISGGTVAATSAKGEGIGNSNFKNEVYIENASVKAESAAGKPLISGGEPKNRENGVPVYLLKLDDVQNPNSLSVDGERYNTITEKHKDDDSLYLYLPEGAHKVKADGKTYKTSWDADSKTHTIASKYGTNLQNESEYGIELTNQVEYNGQEQKPAVIVKNKITGESLTQDTDYTATYKRVVNGTVTDANDFTKPGAITVTIQGKGDYTGTVEKTYQIVENSQRTQKPVITPNGGRISGSQEVTITATDGAKIYYTTDGKEPTEQSTEYTAPFTVSGNTTVKAIAKKYGYQKSETVVAEFTRRHSGSSSSNSSKAPEKSDKTDKSKENSAAKDAEKLGLLEVPTKKDPDAAITVKADKVKANASGDAEISKKAVEDALSRASRFSKKYGYEKNEVVINIPVETDAASAAKLRIKADALKLMTEKKAQAQINTSTLAGVELSQKGVQWLNTQAKNNDVTLEVKKTAPNGQAVAAIGSRPLYNFEIQDSKDGKKLGANAEGVQLVIPYKPTGAEIKENLCVAFVNEAGKISWVEDKASWNDDGIVVTPHMYGTYAIGYAPVFEDTTNHWAKDSIGFISKMGLLNGTGEGQFSPDTALTRGMFVTALGRQMGIDMKDYQAGGFADVAQTSYYAPYVNWAAEMGVVKGLGDGRFEPEQPISRQEMAVIIKRYVETTGTKIAQKQSSAEFADQSSIADWAQEAISSMQQAGILTGRQNGQFDPNSTATRAETAAVLQRFLQN